MKTTSTLFLLWLTSPALAGEWKLQKRAVTSTSTVYSTTTVCPCSTYTTLSSTSSSISTLNSGSIGSPLFTSASATSASSAVTTVPAPVSSNTVPGGGVGSSTTSAVGAGGTIFISTASLPDYQTTVLQQHNVHRRNHTAPDLVWSNTMATYAAEIASTCVYAHSKAAGDGNYGQNIGAGFTPNQIAFMLTNAMYNGEMPKYPGPHGSDNVDISNFVAWGHFSQIVWADTQAVGCATQFCPNGLANAGPNTPPYFTVCNYFPSGNFLGQWSRVHAPIGNPAVVIIP